MHIIRHMCFLGAGALGNMVVSRGQICHADPISPGDALPRERRTGWRMSHAKVCTAFMRSTVLPRNPHVALGNHHNEACRCFLTFSEFTVCKKFRKLEISLQTQISTMALKHFPVLSVKGMASSCWTVRPSKARAVSFFVVVVKHAFISMYTESIFNYPCVDCLPTWRSKYTHWLQRVDKLRIQPCFYMALG